MNIAVFIREHRWQIILGLIFLLFFAAAGYTLHYYENLWCDLRADRYHALLTLFTGLSLPSEEIKLDRKSLIFSYGIVAQAMLSLTVVIGILWTLSLLTLTSFFERVIGMKYYQVIGMRDEAIRNHLDAEILKIPSEETRRVVREALNEGVLDDVFEKAAHFWSEKTLPIILGDSAAKKVRQRMQEIISKGNGPT